MNDKDVLSIKVEIAKLMMEVNALRSDIDEIRKETFYTNNSMQDQVQNIALHNAEKITEVNQRLDNATAEIRASVAEMQVYWLPMVSKLFPGAVDDLRKIGHLIKARPKKKPPPPHSTG